MLTRLALALLWLLHLMPLRALAAVGRGLGCLAYPIARERRRVALTNLRLCFPHMSAAERGKLARRHFQVLMRSLLERGLCWWASAGRLRRLVRIEGLEHLRLLDGQAVILLVPHFVGLDLAATRLALEINAVSIYANQRDRLLNKMLFHGRTRFGDQYIVSRQDGMRPVIKAIRDGRPFYYLPDMDYGPRDAIFVPFFGISTATVPGVSRLARMTGAKVLPCIACMLPCGCGYLLEIHEPWKDFPGESVEADTRRMNAYIEMQVMRMPEQYYWVHKRFKTRPPGESRPY